MFFKKYNFKKKNWLLFIIIINTSVFFGQNKKTENKVAETTKLGKETILKTANTILKNKYPALKINFNDYEITAWYNKNNVIVFYKRNIKFIPFGYKKEDFNYSFSVNVINKEILSFDVFGTSKFYIPTKKDIEKINFIKKQITLKPSFDNEIFEEQDKYIVSTSNDNYFIIYHIDKVTGKEIPKSLVQGNWEPDPFIKEDTDPLIKIVK